MIKPRFYHNIQIQFTTTKGIDPNTLDIRIKELIISEYKKFGILEDTIDVTIVEPEAGNPSYLMGGM